MSRTRTRRWWWLPLLALVSGIGFGCDGNNAENVLPFVPFDTPADVVSPLPGASTEGEYWNPGHALASGCIVPWAGYEYEWRPDADAYDESGVTSLSDDEKSERIVGFVSMRWSDPARFEKMARRTIQSMELPCISNSYEKKLYTEPVELAGLPDGYHAIRWSRSQIQVVLFDTDSRIAMVVAWEERHGSEYDVPLDELVAATNQAWAVFLANNPPVD